MPVGSKSKLANARPGSPSLRTTVPQGIVDQFNLKVGDELDWEISFIEGKKILIVRKVE